MNKKVISIEIIGLFAILLIFIFVFFNDNTKKSGGYEEIKSMIDNKEDILLYISNDYDKCYECKNTDRTIDYYEDIYKLTFYRYNIMKSGDSDYNKLKKMLDFDNNFVVEPSLIIIKHGKLMGIVNEIMVDDDLQKYLIEYGFIDNTNKNVALDMDSYGDVYNSSENKVILCFSYNDNKYRKKLYNLSKKYNFGYYTLYKGISNTNDIYFELDKVLKKEINTPFLLTVSNGNVVDYLKVSNATDEQIIQFLINTSIIEQVEK